MDPMDYILHNHPRSAAHYDPVHAASGPWMPHPQSSPAYPWQSHGQGMPQSYPHHPLQPAMPLPGSDPFHLAPNGGLPPPVPGYHGGPSQDTFTGAMPPRHFHHSPHRLAAPLDSLPVPGHQLVPNGHVNDGAFVNQVPGGRPLGFQAPVGMGMPPVVNNSEPNSLPRPPFALSELPANNFPHHNHSISVPPPPPPGPFSSTQSRRGHFPPSSTSSSRTFREAPSPARSFQPSSGSRRSHPRARRSMSSRFISSESGRDDDDDEFGRQYFLDHIIQNSSGLDGSSMEQQSVDNVLVRQIQLVRGSVSSKMVASKMALRSLQSVHIDDLPEAERTCVICYNDYGVEAPEGINEAPLRLPKCKHVFGDHCIKKWFEDSDSCPYCRDKLHAEPKQHGTSTRAFMNMMRMRGGNIPPGLVSGGDDVFIRALTMTPPGGSGRSSSRQTYSGGRRSPPDDAAEQQRRTRPRHSDPETRGSSTTTHPVSMEGPSSSGPEGNLPANLFTRASPRSTRPPTHQRPWPSHVATSPTRDLSDYPSRPGLLQPSVSMSPSAPSFYPRGGLGNLSGAPDFLTTPAGQQQPSSSSSASSRLPNPLQSPDGVARGGQSNTPHASAPRSNVGNMQGGSGEINQATADQNNRNRPW